MPKKKREPIPQQVPSEPVGAVEEPTVAQMPTDEIFEGLRDRTMTRKVAVRRLLELDCVDVIQFLDLSWVHTVANTGRGEYLGKKTNFAFDISGLPLDQVVLFRDWLTGATNDNAVSAELLEKFVSIAANALKVWIGDKRVDSLV